MEMETYVWVGRDLGVFRGYGSAKLHSVNASDADILCFHNYLLWRCRRQIVLDRMECTGEPLARSSAFS